MTKEKEPEGIQEDIQGIFSWIGNLFKSIFATVEPTVIADLKNFYNTWEPKALAAVEAEASKVISGTEKFDAAVANLTAQISTNGWTVAAGIVETIVQDAYLVYTAKNGTVQITAPK